MRKFTFAAASLAAVLSLSGCITAQNFFGTDDPCEQAEVAYSAFLAVAAANGNVSPEARRAADTGIAAIRAQCADGEIGNVTLAKAVRAYAAGLETWKEAN